MTMGTLVNEATSSQLTAIALQLEECGQIDKPTALALCDCDRLGARIWDLRKRGMNIKTEIRTKTNRFGHQTRYAVYKLIKEESEVGV